MHIRIDTREHKREYERITAQFDALGVTYERKKVDEGDYVVPENPRLVIERKKNLQELCSNVTHQHERFQKELMRAKTKEIKMIILCEHGNGIESLEDVFFWENPRRKDHAYRMVNGKPKWIYIPEPKRATSGVQLYKCLNTIRSRYGVEFVFCEPEETGQKIIELLRTGTEHGL